MDPPYPPSRALSSSPAPLPLPLPFLPSPRDRDHDHDQDPLGLHCSPLTASSIASPLHSDSCSTPRNCELQLPRSPLKLSDSVLPMSSLPSFDFSSAGAYATAYSAIHMNAGTEGAIALPPSFSATRHSEGLTSPSPAQSYSSQDTFASPFSAASPYTAAPTAHHDYRTNTNRRSSAHSSGAYPPSSPTESSHSHASLVAEREMEALYSWARPLPTDPRALALRPHHEDPSAQFADQLSLKGAFMQTFQPLNRSLTVTVSSTSTAMDRPSSFGRTPSTSSAHSVESSIEAQEPPSVPVFVNRSMPTFPMPMPITVASALQLPYPQAPRQSDVAYSQHMQWILPTPQLPRAQSDPIAYQPSPSLTSSVPSALPPFLSSGPRAAPMAPMAPVSSMPPGPLRGAVAPAPSPFYDRLPIDLLAAPSRSSSKRASPALDHEPAALSSAPQSRAESPIAFDESDDLSPIKRARTRPTASAPPTPSDLRVIVKAEPIDPSPSPSARGPSSAGRVGPRVSPPSVKLPRSRSSTLGLSTPRPGPSPPAKDHIRHQGVEKQRRDRTRQLFDALQDFTAARVIGPDDLRAPAEAADPFVCAPTDQPRFAKVQRKGIKLPKEHTLTDALNVLQRQEHELTHYRVLTAALTGPDPALVQRARALLAAPADQAALCAGCGGSLERCCLDQALRESSSPSSAERKGPRPARSRGPLPQ